MLLQAPAPGTSCSGLLSNEIWQGPYYLNDVLIRQDISQGQTGIPMSLNVHLLDTLCNPVVDAFISTWQANATGYYSGFTGGTCGLSTQALIVRLDNAFRVCLHQLGSSSLLDLVVSCSTTVIEQPVNTCSLQAKLQVKETMQAEQIT